MPAIDEFIARWRGVDGSERANYQLFLTELTQLLDLPRPDPASHETEDNAYVFERKVAFHHPDGSESRGYIDLYRRGSFVLEAKQTSQALGSDMWGAAMLRAHGQAQAYARALPPEEGRPPFLIVTDVGRTLEVYSEFSQSGATYVPFPDPLSHRIRLEDLRDEKIRETLRAVWLDPLSLDPSRRSARVTREVAARLAKLAEQLEKTGYAPDAVAAFLMRCLFTMFAEDVGLLPENCFKNLLKESRKNPDLFSRLVPGLWRAMNTGGFSAEIRVDVLRFNGGLFAEQRVLPLEKKQIELLLEAAAVDWKDVEPAIFGTLLERALDPEERHKLGAHYTPRAYVERLVLPTIMEQLREEWQAAHAAALTLQRQGKTKEAIAEVDAFHRGLCKIRVLDPACGSGNFLYVTLEHLKRLEGEIFNTLDDLGYKQGRLEETGVTIDPHQMLGLESNPRAARIAEAVLWIGYLQWHFRTRGDVSPPEPVLRDFHNIENRDAVLDWDRVEYVLGEDGKPVTRWDGLTQKKHPVTGEKVPDEDARVPLEKYINPRKATWPEADFVVGNPPFIGASSMRQALGDGYVEAVRAIYPNVPQSADYVMYWWHNAAELAREEKIRRFGFITTNSIRQTFNRRVVQHHLEEKKPLSLLFAIPDHPWVDSADGAAVRIAMTVGEAGEKPGVLHSVISETEGDGEGSEVLLLRKLGKLRATLRVGAAVSATRPLTANQKISSPGVKLHGAGFIVEPSKAVELGLGRLSGLENHIRAYRNGRDLTALPRNVMVIDLQGLGQEAVRRIYPDVFQWVYERVKPERDHNREAYRRENWWVFGRKHTELRASLADLPRYIATVETSKHRFFTFLGREILPDNKLVVLALDDALHLGLLSSRVHTAWSMASGGWLGVGNDSVYVKTRCFETFPFPDPAPTASSTTSIRDLAEQLDAHRKSRQELHPKLTMTGMYNVLEKLRLGEELTAKDRNIHSQGLVSVLVQFHDELDAAVFDAYGWSDLAPALVGKPGGTTPYRTKPPEQEEAEETLLVRLVELNAARAAEEARGLVRWLRPEFQNPKGPAERQAELIAAAVQPVPTAAAKRAWPKSLADQIRALRSALAEQPGPATGDQLARTFKRARAARVTELLETLVALGQAREVDGRYVST